MLYIGYLIVLDGKNIKKSVLEISIFELPRLENCISRLCPGPLGTPPQHPKWPLRGSPWALKYPYCHQMITQTQPRGNRKVSEKVEM